MGASPSAPPSAGPRGEEILSFEETVRLVRLAAQLALTDGEPLTRRGVPELIPKLAANDGLIRDLALTTDCSFLVDQGGGDRRGGARTDQRLDRQPHS